MLVRERIVPTGLEGLRDELRIIDPHFGRRTILVPDFFRFASGVVLLFEKDAYGVEQQRKPVE